MVASYLIYNCILELSKEWPSKIYGGTNKFPVIFANFMTDSVMEKGISHVLF